MATAKSTSKTPPARTQSSRSVATPPQRGPAPSTSVVRRPSTAMATANKPGRGFEEADRDAYAIPFLFILQDGSPQLDTIKGAKAGMILNSATSELFTEVEVIPVLYRRRFVRWGARDAGGGFKGEVMPSDVVAMESSGEIKRQAQDDGGGLYFPQPDGSINPKRNDSLRDTRSHFVLVNGKPAVIAMSSTQVKKSKNWMTSMQERGGDMWTHSYILTTQKESNDKGKWYGWAIEPAGDTIDNEDIMSMGEGLYNSVVAGAANADYERAGEEATR